MNIFQARERKEQDRVRELPCYFIFAKPDALKSKPLPALQWDTPFCCHPGPINTWTNYSSPGGPKAASRRVRAHGEASLALGAEKDKEHISHPPRLFQMK